MKPAKHVTFCWCGILLIVFPQNVYNSKKLAFEIQNSYFWLEILWHPFSPAGKLKATKTLGVKFYGSSSQWQNSHRLSARPGFLPELSKMYKPGPNVGFIHKHLNLFFLGGVEDSTSKSMICNENNTMQTFQNLIKLPWFWLALESIKKRYHWSQDVRRI